MSNNSVVTGDWEFFMGSEIFTPFHYEGMGDAVFVKVIMGDASTFTFRDKGSG
jgi:hypothetical protein